MKYVVYSGGSHIGLSDEDEPIAEFLYPEHAEKFGQDYWPSTYYVTEKTEERDTLWKG